MTNKVEEITTEVENIDSRSEVAIGNVSEQMTTLETKINNKLKAYVNKDELIRDDAIDIFPRVDHEHSVLLFEFEDNIVSGLIVFKTFAVSESNERQRRFYIKIVDGVIVDYKGVQTETTIEGSFAGGITIKPLAKSEDDRLAFMPTAELIMDSTERLITIAIDSNYKITGAVIEQNTCMRQMVYTTNDIAYLQDIEALNKKIDALAEQSHTNDIQTFCMQDSMREEFATVDEVNTVLTNYVQIKDLPPSVNISEYALKSDIPNTISSLNITKNIAFLGSEMNEENIYIKDWWYKGEEYCRKCVLHISLNPLEDGTDISGDYVVGNYDGFGFVNTEDSGKELAFNPMANKTVCRIFIRINRGQHQAITYTEGFFTLATFTLPYEMSNNDVPSMNLYQELQTKITTLETENATLKAQLAAFEQRLLALEKVNDPDAEWKEFYAEYSEKFEAESLRNIEYYVSENRLNMYPCDDIGEGSWLFVFTDLDGKKHFYETNVDNGTMRFDKFYNNDAAFVEGGPINVDHLNLTNFTYVPVDEVYRIPK